MAFYLVTAVPNENLISVLKKKLEEKSFENMRPFGKALSFSLNNARYKNGIAIWEEEDYCSPPLAEEKAAILGDYFSNIEVKKVKKAEGWKEIENLPYLFHS